MGEGIEALKEQLRAQANQTFPTVARRDGYPIVMNHCFLRVVYDNLFQRKWQEVLDPKKPAIHQLSETQLRRAIELGNEVVADRSACEMMNMRSLEWRGKSPRT
ncbi:hypothetical protein LEM8419_01205 [Neolewinella maritima]|uniref:Uncharacterized protein n=1 Tax=Neolewinella maritima TaxID=1383882 RepID=A0ABM9AZW6_9BACT|nr:hypothetical protein [Neolewinella maritima]CAH0999992.1 hypothetical protein LEM8419_01205 [Neolewinella maritima]